MISESATGMSNGGRCSSASPAMKNTAAPIACQASHHGCQASTIPGSESVPAAMATDAAVSTKGSSYAMSCAAVRSPPSREYLLPLAQPPISEPRTPTPITASTASSPTSTSTPTHSGASGTKARATRYGTSPTAGASRKTAGSARAGTTSSFWANLTPSAISWAQPWNRPAYIGPTRPCMCAMTLCSACPMAIGRSRNTPTTTTTRTTTSSTPITMRPPAQATRVRRARAGPRTGRARRAGASGAARAPPFLRRPHRAPSRPARASQPGRRARTPFAAGVPRTPREGAAGRARGARRSRRRTSRASRVRAKLRRGRRRWQTPAGPPHAGLGFAPADATADAGTGRRRARPPRTPRRARRRRRASRRTSARLRAPRATSAAIARRPAMQRARSRPVTFGGRRRHQRTVQLGGGRFAADRGGTCIALGEVLAGDLLLQFEDALEQRLRARWTAGHVHVDRHDLVDSLGHGVGVPIRPAGVGARPERDHVLGLGHLLVQPADSGRHLVGDRARHDHQVGLPGPRREWDHAEPDEVVACHRGGDELDGPPPKPQVEDPKRVAPPPVQHHAHRIGHQPLRRTDLPVRRAVAGQSEVRHCHVSTPRRTAYKIPVASSPRKMTISTRVVMPKPEAAKTVAQGNR